MKTAAGIWLIAFVCLLVVMLGDGVLPMQVAIPLAVTSLIGLAVVIGVIMLGWVPIHDLIQRTRRAVCQARAERLYADCEAFLSQLLNNDVPPPRSTH
jgi:hypothetical protein